MKAALVTSFNQAPRYQDLADPVPDAPGEMLLDVLAAGLHHVSRGRASGAHYSGADGLPLVPGIDGVGRGPDGKLRYFVQGPGQAGSMASKTVIDISHSIELPDDADPVAIAASMNPAMAAWLALRCRVPFRAGQNVLVLGATGASGSMAVQIARHLGAGKIIAAGRDEQKLAALPALGATATVQLDDSRIGALASDADVVLDFVWGEWVAPIGKALLEQRAQRSRPLAWIHVGSMGGEAASIPGAFLRSTALQIVGSGLGSVPFNSILTELPALAAEIARGTFRIDAKPVPLSEVEQVWGETSGARIVFTP